MKTWIIAFERRFAMGSVITALLLGCSTSGSGVSGETHFLCQETSDCAPHGNALVCVEGECRQVSGSGSGGAAASAQGDGGARSLEGTWDVVGTQYAGQPTSATVTISPSELQVITHGGSFLAVLQGDTFAVAWTYPYAHLGYPLPVVTNTFDAARTPGAGTAGIIPLPLFGDWQLLSQRANGCGATLSPTRLSGSCNLVGPGPVWAPSIEDGQLNATRTEPLGSIFGDLGGSWTVALSGGGSCSVRVEGATITSQCNDAQLATGTFSFSYDQTTAHGVTSQGIEFTAQRR
jgi:hypothetical protein